MDYRDVEHTKTPERLWPAPGMNGFNLTGKRRIIQTFNMDDRRMGMEAELFQIHYDMVHVYPDRLRLMAKQGIIPPKF